MIALANVLNYRVEQETRVSIVPSDRVSDGASQPRPIVCIPLLRDICPDTIARLVLHFFLKTAEVVVGDALN